MPKDLTPEGFIKNRADRRREKKGITPDYANPPHIRRDGVVTNTKKKKKDH